jgi:nitrogenase molybdenum-iron protein NifN
MPELVLEKPAETSPFELTENPCIVCAPLGATLAFSGIRKGMTLLHGSQGCATYIRRYMISHFREPLDAGSSSFTEDTAVFGGKQNLRTAWLNMVQQYQPDCIGVATTCLAETIGEDAAAIQSMLADLVGKDAPLLASVSTASYSGDQNKGFRDALRALVQAACPAGSDTANAARSTADAAIGTPSPNPLLAVFPAMLSPADLRWLKTTIQLFKLEAVLVSDYSDTLDGGPWMDGSLLPKGGTAVADLRRLKSANASLELGDKLDAVRTGSGYLERTFGVPAHRVSLPVGVEATDRFLKILSEISNLSLPKELLAERSRLLDSYIDAHKILSGKRVVLYGDRDQVAALKAFCDEIGLIVLAADTETRDFATLERKVQESSAKAGTPQLLIGNSKGFKTAKKWNIPLVRLGFPIHDRFGGQRLCCLGYSGTQILFDRIVNALLEKTQEDSDVGYTYY